MGKCQAIYTAPEYMTISGHLEHFVVSVASGSGFPPKYVITIHALVDAKTYYAFNLEIHPGTQAPGPYSYSNKPNDIANKLVASISQLIGM